MKEGSAAWQEMLPSPSHCRGKSWHRLRRRRKSEERKEGQCNRLMNGATKFVRRFARSRRPIYHFLRGRAAIESTRCCKRGGGEIKCNAGLNPGRSTSEPFVDFIMWRILGKLYNPHLLQLPRRLHALSRWPSLT